MIVMKNNYLKKYKYCSLLIPCFLCMLVYCGIIVFVPKISLFSKEYSVNNVADTGIELKGQTIVTQIFEMPYDRISGLKIGFQRSEGNHLGKIRIRLLRKKKEICSWQIREDMLAENGFQIYQIGRVIPVEKGKRYVVQISSEENDDTSAAVCISGSDIYGQGKLKVNGKELSGDLVFSIYGSLEGASQKYIFIIIYSIISVLFICCYYVFMQKEINVFDQQVWRLDLSLVAVAALGCALLFSQYTDIELTIRHSEDLISVIRQGRFLEFYDLVLEKAMAGGYGRASFLDGANYNIFLYLILSIIISPWVFAKKVMDFQYDYRSIVIYVQIILILLDFAAAKVVEMLCVSFGCSKKHAKLASYLFLSSAITLFASVGFAQLDIIYIIFMLLALMLYARKRYFSFSLAMSVSIMLKAFPAFLFVPLILLVHKKVWKIVVDLALGLSCTVGFGILFGNSYGYSATKEKMEGFYHFTARLVNSTITGGLSEISIFIFVIVILCIWAYTRKMRSTSELYSHMVFVGLAAYGSFAIFVNWHPQWLVILAVFMAMAVPLIANTRVALYCDLGIQIVYLLFVNSFYMNSVDNSMVNYGILPVLTGHTFYGISIREVLEHIDYIFIMMYSAFAAAIAAFMYLLFRQLHNIQNVEEGYRCERLLVWIRLAVVYGYCLALCVFFFYLG